MKPIDTGKGKIKNIGGKEYIIKSVFVGDKDIKNMLLKLAERKTIKEMGLDIPFNKNS